MDWSKIPDLVAVGLLAGAFVSVARHSHTSLSRNWLTGWILIVFHFFALLLSTLPGFTGGLFGCLGVLALVWAAILFMRASVPYNSDKTSIAMLLALLLPFTAYVSGLMYSAPPKFLTCGAILIGAAPLLVGLLAFRRLMHFLRFATCTLQLGLAIVLLGVQNRPNGADLALNAILFTVYLNAAIHFWFTYHRTSAGAVITISGFFLWANVFTVAPAMAAWFPQVHIEGEVWNLPKYVVAVGMILVLLEDQIAHNRHLALHDALTGLPNRRLFQDRLASALERARRAGTQTALLMVDLDQFKQVNDTMGHHVGDLLLQEVARLFSTRMRRSDTVARMGGDEFAVILESPVTRAEARLVGRMLLKLLEQPLTLEDRVVQVGASLGMAVFPEDGQDMESLCIRADLRMYDNKRGPTVDLPPSDPERPARPSKVHAEPAPL